MNDLLSLIIGEEKVGMMICKKETIQHDRIYIRGDHEATHYHTFPTLFDNDLWYIFLQLLHKFIQGLDATINQFATLGTEL